MNNAASIFSSKHRQIAANLTPLAKLGILLGIIMPLVSAVVYPTYVHTMQRGWVEWSRLLEAPFVVSEVLVICWAIRKGMDTISLLRALPIDVKVAAILLFLGIFTSSIFISAEPLKSITISYITVVHLLFALSVFYLCRTSVFQDYNLLISLLGVGLLVLAALTGWRFIFPPLETEIPGGVIEWGSSLPGFISVRHFGSWTGAVTAGFMAILLYREDNQRVSWSQFFFALSAGMTVWSGTRAAILALVLTAVILILTRRKMPSFQAIGILAILTGTAMTAAWVLIPHNDPVFMLFVPTDIASSEAITSGRLELWAATFHKWQESTLLGWGSGSQFWEVNTNWTHTQPHNAILQFLISWGLIGATGALWILGRAILAVYMITVRQPFLQPMFAILCTLLLMSLLEGMLHYPRFIMLIIVMIAAILACDTSEYTPKATQ